MIAERRPGGAAVRFLPAVALALALAACGDTDAPAEGPAADAPVAATIAIDEPIPRDAIATRIVPASPPVYVAADDQLEFDVTVHNDGSATLASDGSRPVQLGVTLAGPDGVDAAPGVRDFERVRLPPIAPGESARVTVRVPAAPTLGLTVRLELVQELVAWFGQYYQEPTLDLGPFARCDAAPASLCDDHGEPLPTR